MSKSHIAFLVTALLSSPAALADPVALDVARGHRWELHGATVRLYAVGGGLMREARLPGAIFAGSRDASAPAMLIAPRTGELIVASNATARLWRVHPTRYQTQVYDIEVSAEREKDFGFASLAWGSSEKTLYARSSVGSGAWRIDLDTEIAQVLTPAEKLAAGYPTR